LSIPVDGSDGGGVSICHLSAVEFQCPTPPKTL